MLLDRPENRRLPNAGPRSAAFDGISVAVLIPCYNEEISVAKVVADFHAGLPEAVIRVYDNNSSY
jgi:hypothetical protein